MSKFIPIYHFNEHNEAYYYWHKSRHEGTLDTALDIFHVDAHSDMARLQKLHNSLYWTGKDTEDYLIRYRKIAYQEMNISNFIIPAVLNGIAKNVYFIYPDWRKFRRRRIKTNVASAFGEGKVLKHGIRFPESEKVKFHIAYPDLREYNYVMTDVERIPSKRKVILDIDLDYFACTDSITNRMRYDLAITPGQYRNRERFFRENENLRFSGLEIEFERRGREFFAIVRFKKQGVREHLPTESAIRKEIDKLAGILVQKKIRPAVVTICRSCISGFCPPDRVQMIEDYLLQQLRSCFPAMSIAN